MFSLFGPSLKAIACPRADGIAQFPFSTHSRSIEILTRLSQRDNDQKTAETQASLSKPFEDLVNKGSAHDSSVPVTN